MAKKRTQYVAYTDLGGGSGAPVDPDDHGGEDSDNFQYMLERRTVVPLSDPDAAIAMGRQPDTTLASAEDLAAKDAELESLRARVVELEAAKAAADKAAADKAKG